MEHYPGGQIHFAADGTVAQQQAALQATRRHVMAFGDDYNTRDWDFLTLPTCSSCGADLHGGQVRGVRRLCVRCFVRACVRALFYCVEYSTVCLLRCVRACVILVCIVCLRK